MSRRAALGGVLVSVGALAAWRSRAQLGDAVVDALCRRPSGPLGRLWWRDPRPLHANFTDVLDALALIPADRLLDIGCGGGTFLSWALRSGCSAAGLDHSPDMVAVTAASNRDAVRTGRLEVRKGTAEQLPFGDARFSCVAMLNVFFFLDGPATLAEVYRVLDADGRLALYTVAPDPPATLVPALLARRMRLYPDDELIRLLAMAGFIHITVQRRDQGCTQLVTARRGL